MKTNQYIIYLTVPVRSKLDFFKSIYVFLPNISKLNISETSVHRYSDIQAGSEMILPFCLPSMMGKPGSLKEAGVAPARGKTIRIARALLVTAGSEGSDRKRAAHSVSEPDSALRVGKRAK